MKKAPKSITGYDPNGDTPYIERKMLNYFKERIGDKYKDKIEQEQAKDIEITVCKMVQEDHYKDGCDPDTINDIGVIYTYQNKSLEEVKNVIKLFCGFDCKPQIYEDRIEVCTTENACGEQPSLAEQEAFKRGEIKLYCADYSFTLAKVKRVEFDNRDLNHYFGRGTSYNYLDESWRQDEE